MSAALGAAVTVAAYAATAGGSQAAGAGGSQAAGAGGSQAAGAQPAGIASRASAAPGTGVVAPAVSPYLDPKQLKAVPVGSGKVSKPVQKILTSPAVTMVLDVGGIPEVAVKAYQRAAAAVAVSDAACRLPWQLLAAIGRVESDNGQFGGAMLLADGYGTQPIYGLPLDGRNGVALIRDTDGGKLDGDPNFDRAVGPMQFIPSTWAQYGVDGNGDGKKDPNNIFDAALAAADYLCVGGGDLAIPAQETAAVLSYNDADEYAHVVVTLAASYEHGDFATLPATGPMSISGASTPGTPSSPPSAETPAPTKTPIQSASQTPPQTPAPPPTTPSSPATAALPTISPVATPTESPSVGTVTTAPATPTPTPTDTTEAAPTASGQPSQAPVPSFTPPTHHPRQSADIGWAPAMRQVVVKLLGAAKAAPTQPVRPTYPGLRPTETSSNPARRTTGPNAR